MECDATIGFASIQNSVPILRALRISNNSDAALENLEVHVTCNPGFAEALKLRFEKIAVGESRLISPVALQPDHAYLSGLQESVAASIRVAVIAKGEEIAGKTQPIEVLAYDQWAGTRSLPELLAAFCMPNIPAIDVLIGKASKLLRSVQAELGMNGYQSNNRDVVWKQVSAIYSTLAAENLQYAEARHPLVQTGKKSGHLTAFWKGALRPAWTSRCCFALAWSKLGCVQSFCSRKVMRGLVSGSIRYVFQTR